MNNTQRNFRRQVAGGNLNGFELWRRLYWNHLDGESLSEIRGASHCINYPKCN